MSAITIPIAVHRAAPDSQAVVLCDSQTVTEGGPAVPFDVVYAGEVSRAFAIRFEGTAHAYLNRCTHVAMEMDWQPN